MKKILLLFLTFTLVSCSENKEPKYVFYFIGDGMGVNHVAITRAAVASQEGYVGFADLSFTNFPVATSVTSHSATRLTTDSAAAGTALATGSKTYPGAIGVDTAHIALKSIAYDMKEWGRKIAIITSVNIDDATPAAFYAHQNDRGMHAEIARELPSSEFDLFVSGGIKKLEGVIDSLPFNGYTFLRGRDAKLEGDKIVWSEREDHQTNFTYAIDRTEDDMTLPEVVQKGIEYFGACDEGFFMMAEGGKIDGAAHANDAPAIVHEVLDFSEAVQKAIDFYNLHPEETLIIVTADHETGGISIGRGDRGYDTDLKQLFLRSNSKIENDSNDIKHLDSVHYAAGVQFTTGSHTSSPVPLYVMGAGSERFLEAHDNTDIVKILRQMHN